MDDPDTWLDLTDLVFIDEMGAGYSRMAKPEYAPLFFTPRTDAEVFTEFMRIYLRRYVGDDAPVVLRGGSYGSIRGALVAAAGERRGLPVKGLILTEMAVLNDLERVGSGRPLRRPRARSHACKTPTFSA